MLNEENNGLNRPKFLFFQKKKKHRALVERFVHMINANAASTD